MSSDDAPDAIRQVLGFIGEDPEREGLKDTPSRVVKSWGDIFAGYSQKPASILSRRFASANYDQMIVLRDIEMYSTCEHHMLPFFGRAHVAYIPGSKGQVVGLSKLARLVDCFARRLQIQERLTDQIANAIEEHLDASGVMVVVKARHFCMMSRGVGKQNSEMVTSAVRGVFAETNSAARAEFLSLTQ